MNNIPMSEWGKDHWSTLGYIECRCVDHGGHVSKPHLRADPARHPLFGHIEWDKDIPTRLKGDVKRPEHDDIDCIEDMVAAGLVLWEGTGVHPIFKLTDLGMMVCNALRNHKASGGNWGNFSYEIPPVVSA